MSETSLFSPKIFSRTLALTATCVWLLLVAGATQVRAQDVAIPALTMLSDQYGGTSLASDVEGTRLALGMGLRVHILDVGSEEVTFLGQTPIHERVVRSVRLSGDLLFVGLSDTGGVFVYDVAEPANPRRLASFPTFGEVRGFAVRPERVYVAVLGGIRALDRPAPDQFVEGTLDLPYRSVAVVITAGDKLYVLESTSGLHVVDLSGAEPTPRGSLAIDSLREDTTKQIVWLGEDRLLVVQNWVYVVDVSDPDEPVLLETLPLRGHAVDAAINETRDRFAVGHLEGGVVVYDSSDPLAIKQMAAASGGQGVLAVSWGASGLMWTDWLEGMRFSPRAGDGDLAASDLYLPTSYSDSVTVGDSGRVFTTGALGGMDVLERPSSATGDAAGDGSLRRVANASLPDGVRSTRVRAAGGLVGIFGPHGGIWVLADDLEAAGKAAPDPLSLQAFDGAFASESGRMFVAGGFDGLHEISIGSEALRRAATLPTESQFSGVELWGDMAAVASREEGLLLANVAEPGKPRWIGNASTAGPAADVAMMDGFAYTVSRNGLFEIFDLADPSAPTQTALVPLGGAALRMEVDPAAKVVYVLVNEESLVPVNVADPRSPSVGRAYQFPERINDLTIHEGKVWIAAGRLGLLVANLPFEARSEPPAMPTVKPTREPTSEASDETGAGDAGQAGMGRGVRTAMAGLGTVLAVVIGLGLWSRSRARGARENEESLDSSDDRPGPG